MLKRIVRNNKHICLGVEQKFRYRDADGKPFDTGKIGLLRKHPEWRRFKDLGITDLDYHFLWGHWIFTGAQRNRQHHGLVEYSSPPFEVHPVVDIDNGSAQNYDYLDNVVDRVFHDMLVHRAITRHFDNPDGTVQLHHVHFNISYPEDFPYSGLLEQYIMPCLSLLWATPSNRIWARNPSKLSIFEEDKRRQGRYHIGTGSVMTEESIKAGIALLASFVYGFKENRLRKKKFEMEDSGMRNRKMFRYSPHPEIFRRRDYRGYVGRNVMVSELDPEIAVHGRRAKIKVDGKRRKITIEDLLKSIIERMEHVIIRYCGRENFDLLVDVAEKKRLIDIDYADGYALGNYDSDNGTGNGANARHTGSINVSSAMIDDSYFARHGTTAKALIEGFQHTELSRMYADIAMLADFLNQYYLAMPYHDTEKLNDVFHADVIDWDRAVFSGGREHEFEQYTVYFDRFPELRKILYEAVSANPVNPDLPKINSRIREIGRMGAYQVGIMKKLFFEMDVLRGEKRKDVEPQQ